MAAEEPARRRGPAKKNDDRKPIYERLAPFAPWDQRSAPPLLDDSQVAARAAAQAVAASAVAEAAEALAGRDGTAAGVASTLRHLAEVSRWHAQVWAEHLGGGTGSGADAGSNALAAPARAAAERPDTLEAVAGLSRVALPGLIADAVLLRAELGDDLAAGPARWLALITEDLEAQRSELELVVQAQLAPGDGRRLADSCAEVAQAV